MSMRRTEKGIKKFTDSEKQSIIKEAAEKGVKVTLEKYDLYPATYYYWKKKFASQVNSIKEVKEMKSYAKKLEKENQTLKLLLAEKELEGKLKDELLKKKYPHLRKKS